jgi:hypothetical protein
MGIFFLGIVDTAAGQDIVQESILQRASERTQERVKNEVELMFSPCVPVAEDG